MASPPERSEGARPRSSPVDRLRALWRGGPHVYLASREDIFHVKRLLGELPSATGGTWVGIIGGLGTLSFISAVSPDRIILVDVNRDQVELARCVLELIGVSPSRSRFVEAFFSRRFLEDETEFLKQPGDLTVFNDTLGRVSSKEAFQKFFPAVRDGRFEAGGLAIVGNRCCASLKLSGPQRGVPTGDNFLYWGEGWLASDESYDRLRSILHDARIELVYSPVESLEIDPGGGSLYFHGSNVEDAFPTSYRRFVARTHDRLALADGEPTFVWFSTYHAVNVTRFKRYVRRSDSVHSDCAAKVAAHTRGRTVLELVPGSYCFGRELGAAHVDVERFEGFRPHRRYDVVVSHILFGSRLLHMTRNAFQEALGTMLTISDEVVIVEHNAASEGFRDARLLGIGDIVALLSRHHGIGLEVEHSKGHGDDRRNLIVSVARRRSAGAR
jgi:hypothetical protein